MEFRVTNHRFNYPAKNGTAIAQVGQIQSRACCQPGDKDRRWNHLPDIHHNNNFLCRHGTQAKTQHIIEVFKEISRWSPNSN